VPGKTLPRFALYAKLKRTVSNAFSKSVFPGLASSMIADCIFNPNSDTIECCCYWRCTIYAIVETGGKQYKVAPGDTVDVDLTGSAEGDKVELDKVLLISDDKKVVVGTPTIEGAKVLATSKGMTKGDKIIVFKFKNKDHFSKKTGHRQKYTRLTIDDIIPGSNKN
jgi:large subunit ribosomal protein L21